MVPGLGFRDTSTALPVGLGKAPGDGFFEQQHLGLVLELGRFFCFSRDGSILLSSKP